MRTATTAEYARTMEAGPGAETAALAAAAAGDETAFRALAEPYGRELHVHCYRMLGSLDDAQDAVQETLVRAWRNLDRFEGRSSFRKWIHSIATNVCLNVRRGAGASAAADVLRDPYPDELLDALPVWDDEPAVRYDRRESIQLAFLAAIQLLPPRQRAVLILRDVLGWSAREVAEALGMSVAGANSTLQRARAALERQRETGRLRPERVPPADELQHALLRRFVAAWEAADVDGLVSLLRDDAVLAMPPFPERFVGRAAIGEFLSTVPAGGALDRIPLVPTRANRSPAVAAYMPDDDGVARAYGVMVLSVEEDSIAEIVGFARPELVAAFGLPEVHDDV